MYYLPKLDAADPFAHLRTITQPTFILNGNVDASHAGGLVGYESPSQFSREYSRLFGAPPLRDIKNLQQAAAS